MAQSRSLGVLLDHAQDTVVLLDEQGRVTYSNAAVERILGWAPERFEGRNVFDLVHPADLDEVQSAFGRVLSNETFVWTTAEYRIRAEDGSWVWLESRISNLPDDRLEGCVVSSRDITDRVEAQRERQEAMRRLRELSATTGDVLWMFDSDWSELLFVNPAYEEVFGRPIEELEANPRTFLDAVHPEDVPTVTEAMDGLSAGESREVEYRVNPEKDYGVWVWVRAEPIIEDGEVVRITGFTRDITDRYRRERQLRVMDNLLRHNLRNDLNVILGNAQGIEDRAPEVTDLTAVIRRTGEDLLRSAEKDREIIDLLTRRVARTRVDIVDTVETGAETARDRFPGARIDVSAPDEAAARVLSEIRLAVVELLENSIVHSESDRPSVTVTVRTERERVVVTVADSAPPIPAVEANVLEGDHEMSDIYHSSGLGLWLAYWVVELSDGRVRVSSRAGSGNRIRVDLPRSRE